MCHQKDPTFFRSLSPKDPHFYQLSPNDPLFLTNSLSPKDPDTSLSLEDPWFSNLIVKQVTIFGGKMDFSKISTNLTKCWEIFGHFGPESPYFWCILLKDPLFLCGLSLKDLLFDVICHQKAPTSEVLGGTRIRHFHMWVPPGINNVHNLHYNRMRYRVRHRKQHIIWVHLTC